MQAASSANHLRLLAFAIVEHGGFLGIRKALTAVPFSALSCNSPANLLVLKVSKERFDSAPPYHGIDDLTTRAYAENDYRYFGQQPYWLEQP